MNGASVVLAHPGALERRRAGSARRKPSTLISGKTELPAPAESPEAQTHEPAQTSAPTLPRVRTRSVARKVVIDPGHGGDDTGTPARFGNLDEKEIALEVALAVGAHLRSQGVTVIFTRTTDVCPSLEERADLANRENPDLFISIHVNAERARSCAARRSITPPLAPWAAIPPSWTAPGPPSPTTRSSRPSSAPTAPSATPRSWP